MRKIGKTAAMLFLCAMALSVSAFAETIGTGTVEVNDWLNLRAEANPESAVLAKAPAGTHVAVTEALDGWYKVEYNGLSGYMSADYLRFSENASENLGPGTVRGTTVRLRQSAGYESEVLGYVNTGDKLAVTGIAGAWYAVSVGGKAGFIHSDYVVLGDGADGQLSAPSSAESLASGEKIVETARQYLGCAYVYGGMSPSGFDCSGFVNYVYAECGYDNLQRVADDIAREGQWVAKEDLQPGDIVCFHNAGSSYIGHVGIYIGNGEFIHASTTKTGVIISSLDSDWYVARYDCARRYC